MYSFQYTWHCSRQTPLHYHRFVDPDRSDTHIYIYIDIHIIPLHAAKDAYSRQQGVQDPRPIRAAARSIKSIHTEWENSTTYEHISQ